ncbi:MAG TPA: sigma 54-interacting transcriptional regulator [Phycisphaerae bacterium]|nr:sigma 54-interacting transcriptional regulator [Phycisphaerae bacterium]
MTGNDNRLSAMIENVDSVARVLDMLAQQAQSSAPVLMLGPRCSGACFLAEALHACSPRRDRPFVRARCGLYSGMLLEAQLFGRSNSPNGYLRNTLSRKKGMVAIADGGSLFVEQIQNANAGVQDRLFDLITHQEYSDFEQTSTYAADVRLIVSARCDLENRVNSGLFLPNLHALLQPACIELHGSCISRDGILSVIDLLRAQVTPQTTHNIGRVTEWWMQAARTATQTPNSAVLRYAVEAVTRQLPDSASSESIFLAALQYMARNSSKPRRPTSGGTDTDIHSMSEFPWMKAC